MQKFDVLIVGAGMVGLTLALALRQSSQLKIALVDSSAVAELDDSIDVRVSAINVASKNIFANLGIWSAIESSRVQDYQHMHVWDKAGVGKLDFSAKDSASFPPEESLGWIIENKVIRHALWQQAERDEGIHFFNDNKLASISHGESEVFATFVHDTFFKYFLFAFCDPELSCLIITEYKYSHSALSRGHSVVFYQLVRVL